MSPSHNLTSVLRPLAVAVALGWGTACGGAGGADAGAAPAKESLRIDAQRYRVPLFDDDRSLGGARPLVTVVVFSDYACPPCSSTWTLMHNLAEDYGEDLRIVWRGFTVAGFPQGEAAMDAALAAGRQGKFWEMHRRLFDSIGHFDRPTLRAHAEALGLETQRFLDDLDTGADTAVRIRHRREAARLGVRGLPVLFVNGLLLVGGQTDEAAWHGLLDAEIARSRTLLTEGTPREKLYDAILANAADRPIPSAAEPDAQELRDQLAKKQAEAAGPTAQFAARPGERYQVSVGELPVQGPDDALVTVVEFADLRCPFCRRAHEDALTRLVKEHRGDVRLAVRHYPLEIHPEARGAAVATVAAARQGKFWEMVAAIYADETTGRAAFQRHAQELGLDGAKFLADLDDPAVAALVDADTRLGHRLGVGGTPGFFVNGRFVSGWDPGAFDGIVREELELARKRVRDGAARKGISAAITAEGLPEGSFPNP
jgi:protein-disulfide isomerase